MKKDKVIYEGNNPVEIPILSEDDAKVVLNNPRCFTANCCDVAHRYLQSQLSDHEKIMESNKATMLQYLNRLH